MSMTINVAEDYSAFVLGRYPDDSDWNGEDFREKHLIPALENLLAHKDETLVVDFDGTFSCDPSFLEEAFGGAIRYLKKKGIDSSQLWHQRITIKDEDAAQRAEILGYIDDALHV